RSRAGRPGWGARTGAPAPPASAADATKVIERIRPVVSARRCGANSPGSRPSVIAHLPPIPASSRVRGPTGGARGRGQRGLRRRAGGIWADREQGAFLGSEVPAADDPAGASEPFTR